jgi:phosphatidylinositol alpha-1,6-mannosyltransferase
MSRTAPRIGVVLEERFKRLPDDRLFSPSGFGADFWSRYSAVFGPVRIIARIEPCTSADPSWAPVPAPVLGQIHPFLGPAGLMHALPHVLRSFHVATRDLDGLIVRAPGTLALLAAQALRRRPRPFAVELVGDPVDVFGAGIGGWFGLVLQRIFARNTRWLCAHASAVSYVTRETLQRRYPPAPNVPTIACSSVQLLPDDFADNSDSRTILSADMPSLGLMCAASLEVPYKGVDVLIDALALLEPTRRPTLTVAGEGRLRPVLEARAAELGLQNTVRFLGRLDKGSVTDAMRRCDLYVQPSLTEGLPRAIVEAMATAAPVIGTSVGGIPELLDRSEMVPPGDARALADLITAVLADPARRATLSRRNLALARDFAAHILDARRRDFYTAFVTICSDPMLPL